MKIAKLRITFRVFTLSICLLLAHSMPCVATNKIILIGSHDTKESFHGRWLNLIYTELFKRLGYELQYDSYPSDLSSKISDSGRVDGEINRVSMYQKNHPEMIKIDEPHFHATVTAYTTDKKINLDGWKSLKDTNYHVVYRRGTRIVEKNLSTIVPKENLSTVGLTNQGLKMLISGRIDVYVDVEDTVAENLLRLNPTEFDQNTVFKAGIMAEDTLHVYLHKKNKTLAPQVDHILKEMKNEGLVEQYKEKALKMSLFSKE